jgi:hypothetical protein
MNIPKIVFIVPFRNREMQKIHFHVYMKYIMEDYNKNDYEIYYSHQCDTRAFNRGAVKNIGFLAIKDKYPNDYKNITFVFNDIDTLPYKKNSLNYRTGKNKIKHFYGFEFALGGIFSITGEDFEKINGFPNFWGWGLEDNRIQQRAQYFNIIVDRSKFFPINSPNILHFDKEQHKITTRKALEKSHTINSKINDGLRSLKYRYKIENEYINIYNFDSVFLPYQNEKIIVKDMKEAGGKFKYENRFAGQMKMQIGIK